MPAAMVLAERAAKAIAKAAAAISMETGLEPEPLRGGALPAELNAGVPNHPVHEKPRKPEALDFTPPHIDPSTAYPGDVPKILK